jgi:hypothetical protein
MRHVARWTGGAALSGLFVGLAWLIGLKPTHWVEMNEHVSPAWEPGLDMQAPYCRRITQRYWTGGRS